MTHHPFIPHYILYAIKEPVEKKLSPVALFQLEIVLEEELLVISQLDHQRAVEGVLQPLGEVERDQVSEVKRLARRSTTYGRVVNIKE